MKVTLVLATLSTLTCIHCSNPPYPYNPNVSSEPLRLRQHLKPPSQTYLDTIPQPNGSFGLKPASQLSPAPSAPQGLPPLYPELPYYSDQPQSLPTHAYYPQPQQQQYSHRRQRSAADPGTTQPLNPEDPFNALSTHIVTGLTSTMSDLQQTAEKIVNAKLKKVQQVKAEDYDTKEHQKKGVFAAIKASFKSKTQQETDTLKEQIKGKHQKEVFAEFEAAATLAFVKKQTTDAENALRKIQEKYS